MRRAGLDERAAFAAVGTHDHARLGRQLARGVALGCIVRRRHECREAITPRRLDGVEPREFGGDHPQRSAHLEPPGRVRLAEAHVGVDDESEERAAIVHDQLAEWTIAASVG